MKNQCSKIKHTFPDYLTGDLDTGSVQALQDHIGHCDSCRLELEELTHTWTQLAILPEQEPGPNLRKNFYTMLESYQEGLSKESGQSFKVSFNKLMEKLFPRRPVFQAAFALVILVFGFFGGYILTVSLQNRYTDQIFHLQSQEQQMRQNLTLALLEQNSPSQRLKGIHWSSTVQNPRPKLLEALLQTLNNDPNVNVRLSAVDALYLFADSPIVKEGIRESLPKQDSPLVQVALINLLVELREKRAVESLKKLIDNEKIDPTVKEHAQNLIKKLI